MPDAQVPQMRAVSQHTAGGPEVLTLITTDRPVAGPVEILVKVHAAGVNPTDWYTRADTTADHGSGRPAILGYDVSGVVEAVGPGVTAFEPGDRVYGMPRFPHPASAYAEYVTGPTRHFTRLPASLDHIQGAALPLAALTAWQALVDTADVRPGQRVLIHAAAGGVGHLGVQIAKSRGAHVIGTARRIKHEFLRSLGADELIDYTEQDFAETLREVDVVLNTIEGDYAARSLRTLRPGGTLVSILPLDPAFPHAQAREAGVRAVFMLVEPDRAGLEAISALVESGRLQVRLDSVFPLAEAARAHARGETSQATGKIVLSVASPVPLR